MNKNIGILTYGMSMSLYISFFSRTSLSICDQCILVPSSSLVVIKVAYFLGNPFVLLLYLNSRYIWLLTWYGSLSLSLSHMYATKILYNIWINMIHVRGKSSHGVKKKNTKIKWFVLTYVHPWNYIFTTIKCVTKKSK